MKLEELTQAARAAAPGEALSDERKRAILARVHAEAPRPRSWWEQLGAGVRAWAAVPVASLLMLVGIFAWRALAPTAAPAPAQREVLAPGVELVRLTTTDASVEIGEGEVRVALRRGAVAAELDAAAGHSLRFSTPMAEVVVRGTVLYVESDATATRVGVVSGLVEVRPARGEVVWVRAGETVAIGAGGLSARSGASERHHAVAALWPGHRPAAALTTAPQPAREAASETAPPQGGPLAEAGEPAPKSPRPPHRAQEAPALEPRLPQSEVLALARTAWARGEQARAVTELEAWIARAPADEDLDEPRYLLASFLRSQRSYEAAVRVLEALTQSPRAATARLAALERARVLADQLDRRAEAITALRELSGRHTSDGVSPQALLELCRLHVSAAEWQAARDCLDELDARFPNTPEAQPAAALRRKLPPRPR